MKIRNLYQKYINLVGNLKSLPLLLLRLTLAYGFFGPAKMKLSNIQGIADWFDGMGYPLPLFNAYMAAFTESLGVLLLLLGLGIRIISIPLMFVMVVAIATVHLGHGFDSGDNGFEIPLYYMLMLFTLLVYGGGKWSVDHLLGKKKVA